MPSTKKQTYLVGNRLVDFATNENVITISNLEKLIQSALIEKKVDDYIIDIGQGVCSKIIKRLQALILDSGLSRSFQLNIPASFRKSPSCLTHKHKAKNIMISDPIQYQGATYESLLMLEEYCAEMSDHVSGQHIQGMVLVEAARQMVIAVTEKFLLADGKKRKLNFITHSMDTNYHHFVFPLPVTIRYQILDMRRGNGCNLSSKALISFIQNEIAAAEIIFKYSALDSVFIAEKESYLADKCIKAHLNRDSNTIAV